MSDLVVPVYVVGWQQGCCGDSFALGDRVAWRLRLQPAAWWPQVALPVTVTALPRRARRAWLALGNEPGPSPAVARLGGLTVFVADEARLVDHTLSGGLQEDRHVDVPAGVPPTTAVVRRIRTVTRTFRTLGSGELHAVPGSPDLHDVDAADRSLPEAAPDGDPLLRREVTGLLVDLAVHRV